MPTVRIHDRIFTVPQNTLLSEILPGMEHPCGGKRLCGKCRVCVEGALSEPTAEELRYLTAEQRGQGMRLSCCTRVMGGCRVFLPENPPQPVDTAKVTPAAHNPAFSRLGLAIDFGSTNIVIAAYAPDGVCAHRVAIPNPQRAFGADVISRIEAALNGKQPEMHRLWAGAFSDIVDHFPDFSAIDSVVFTGNTVMLTLLTNEPIAPFATAPFTGVSLFGVTTDTDALGMDLPQTTKVYLPPCASAFVGADALCSALAVGLLDTSETALMLDIGTNGEMLLHHEGRLYACSTAAGPAFEGVGISCSMSATDGAIHRVELVNGALYPHTINNAPAQGVCGSGLVDAVACLLMTGDLERDGHLTTPTTLAPGVTLTQEDICNLQVSKSAIRAGITALLTAAGVAESQVKRLWITGGFGRDLNLNNAAAIGLLPPELIPVTTVVEDGALTGAAALLLDRDLRQKMETITPAIQVVELASDPCFAEELIRNMSF